MKIVICLFFVNYVLAEHHLSIVLLSAPKKIPMLTYTIEYFLHAYNYNNGGIIIDGIFMGKGCNCDHPEFDQAVKTLKENGFPTYDVDLNKDVLDVNSEFGKRFFNFYSGLWNDMHCICHPILDYAYMKTVLIITDFTHQLIDEMERKTPNYEYVLFLEDDVAFNKDFFVRLSEEMDKKYEDELLMKLAYPHYYRIPETHWKLPRDACIWGYWGMLYDRYQLKQWKKFGKYQTYMIAGDLYHGEMYKMFNQSIRMEEISYHFGRDKEIKPRDERFW